MELLNAKHPGIPPTLRDDSLKEEAEQLKQHYMAKVNSEVSEAHQNLQPVLQHIKELKRKGKSEVNLRSSWWLDVIQQAIQYSMDDDLVGRIQNELTCSYKQQANKLSMADKFRDARGLQFLLSTQMDDLMKSQKTVQDAVKKLEGPPSQQVIEDATFCHLRPVRLPLNNCVFCKADELFTDYESKLFSHTPTFVHRFLIKSTIEERMQAILKTAEKSHSSTSMKRSEASVFTVADLTELFTEDSESLE